MSKIGKYLLSMLALIAFGLAIAPISAGQTVLSNNSGTDNTVWFISGEPSLVMNGFDLSAFNVQVPAVIDRVSIAVNSPVPGASIDVLIYEDANGGSPSDARLVSQSQVDIRDAGTFTYTLPTPVTVNQRAIWIGFYLPVNFRFLADTSGSSVLTYWAWTPGGRFDVGNLASAQILGPADGSAPVNINLGGKARITAEITGGTAITGTPGTPLPNTTPGAITQQAGGTANFSIMRQYPQPGCDTLYYDSEDVSISYRGSIALSCTLTWEGYAPANPQGYQRKQLLYDVTIFDDRGNVQAADLPIEVTHCIKPNPADIDRAVIGLAYGSPRSWIIKPTLRFGEYVCAEIGRAGLLAYFIPG
jgi:hypothetical protein